MTHVFYIIFKIKNVYSPKESSVSIVGPHGLSGSLFLGLLVLDFYHPTNGDLYLVGGGVGGWGVFLGQILTFFKVVWKLFKKYLGIV